MKRRNTTPEPPAPPELADHDAWYEFLSAGGAVLRDQVAELTSDADRIERDAAEKVEEAKRLLASAKDRAASIRAQAATIGRNLTKCDAIAELARVAIICRSGVTTAEQAYEEAARTATEATARTSAVEAAAAVAAEQVTTAEQAVGEARAVADPATLAAAHRDLAAAVAARDDLAADLPAAEAAQRESWGAVQRARDDLKRRRERAASASGEAIRARDTTTPTLGDALVSLLGDMMGGRKSKEPAINAGRYASR